MSLDIKVILIVCYFIQSIGGLILLALYRKMVNEYKNIWPPSSWQIINRPHHNLVTKILYWTEVAMCIIALFLPVFFIELEKFNCRLALAYQTERRFKICGGNYSSNNGIFEAICDKCGAKFDSKYVSDGLCVHSRETEEWQIFKHSLRYKLCRRLCRLN